MAEHRFCTNCGAQFEASSIFCSSCGHPFSNPSSAESTGHIKHRNILAGVVYYAFTLGFYSIYWYFATLEELQVAKGKEKSGCRIITLLFVPILGLIAYWKRSSEYAGFIDDKYPGIAIFILWLVFGPVAWFLVQADLNQAAKLHNPSSSL